MFEIVYKRGSMNIGTLPFLLLQASVLLIFTTFFSWTGVLICVLSYLVRMFAITAFYHRYFSHRTFAMGRPMQFLAALLGATATQKGPLWWAAHHRQHHKSSDTEDDPHNSHEGFWHAHWMWFLYQESSTPEYDRIADLVRYPELRLVDRLWYIPPVLLGVGLFIVGGWHWVVWGYFVSTFLLSNGTYTINSLMHFWGRQRFYTGDESRNHWLLALVTLGEGWHNNHHRYQSATRNGFFWYEFDPTYYLLKLMSFFGLVRELKPVPDKIMDEARLNRHLRRKAKGQGMAFAPRQVGVRDLLVQMPFAAQGFVAENLDRVRGEMQGLGRFLEQRGEELGAEVQGLRTQVAEQGRVLEEQVRGLAREKNGESESPDDLFRWGEELMERGQALRRGIEILGEEVLDRGQELRREVEALGGEVVERGQTLRREIEALSEEVGATARHLAVEMEALRHQVADTIVQLCEEVEVMRDHLADGLRDQMGVMTDQLVVEIGVLNRLVVDRGQPLRGEVEAWSRLLPQMAKG